MFSKQGQKQCVNMNTIQPASASTAAFTDNNMCEDCGVDLGEYPMHVDVCSRCLDRRLYAGTTRPKHRSDMLDEAAKEAWVKFGKTLLTPSTLESMSGVATAYIHSLVIRYGWAPLPAVRAIQSRPDPGTVFLRWADEVVL